MTVQSVGQPGSCFAGMSENELSNMSDSQLVGVSEEHLLEEAGSLFVGQSVVSSEGAPSGFPEVLPTKKNLDAAAPQTSSVAAAS